MMEERQKPNPRRAICFCSALLILLQTTGPLYPFQLGACLQEEPQFTAGTVPEIAPLFFPLLSLHGGDEVTLEKQGLDQRSGGYSITWEQPLLPGSNIRSLMNRQREKVFLQDMEREERIAQKVETMLELFCSIITRRKEREVYMVELESQSLMIAGAEERNGTDPFMKERLHLAQAENRIKLGYLEERLAFDLRQWKELSIMDFPGEGVISIRNLKQVGSLPEEDHLMQGALSRHSGCKLLRWELEQLKGVNRALPHLLPDIVLTTALHLPASGQVYQEIETSWALQISFSFPGFTAGGTFTQGRRGDRSMQTGQEGSLLLTPYPTESRTKEEILHELEEEERRVRMEMGLMLLELAHMEKSIALGEESLHVSRKGLQQMLSLWTAGNVSEAELSAQRERVAREERDHVKKLCARLLLLGEILNRGGLPERILTWEF